MMDKRKTREAILDAQLLVWSAQIAPFRPRAVKDAIDDGSRDDFKGGAERARAEGHTSFHSTASKFK